MKNHTIFNRISRFFKVAYLKLFRINDTPQKIAIGIGLGVFFGVLPGMGPVAALFLAFILKVNRAGALLGSLLTNTWLSVPTFFVSVKIGSVMTGSNYADIYKTWSALIKNFTWDNLFQLSIYKIVIPVILGYVIVALFIGIAAYVTALGIIKTVKRKESGGNSE